MATAFHTKKSQKPTPEFQLGELHPLAKEIDWSGAAVWTLYKVGLARRLDQRGSKYKSRALKFGSSKKVA